MEFSASVISRSDRAQLTVSGELDAFTALKIRRPIGEALDLGCRHFTVDLGDLTFIDAGGLSAFVRLRKTAQHVDGSLTFVDAGEMFRRTCEYAGLTRAFELD
jgi:anti-sigma B factor antagonist